MRRLELTVRPESRFPVPVSDGYSVYSALLNAVRSVDETVSERLHDSPLGGLHSSGLRGVFGGSDRSHHKTVLPNESYDLTLGVVDPDDESVFQTLVTSFVLRNDRLGLTDGSLRVEAFESENVSHADLLERAADTTDPTLSMKFRTATCIQEADEVTTMFPHRGAVFSSLASKWNRTAPETLELDVSRAEFHANLVEKPDPRSYDTHSVLVNRVEDDDGNERPIFRQGFTGECAYAFKNASASFENATTALALFAEFSGVGSAVSRGCGNTTVEVVEG